MREQSAYVAEEPELRNLKVLFSLMVFLIITDFVMPQYFGIHIGYDLTCTRLADLLIVLYIFESENTDPFWRYGDTPYIYHTICNLFVCLHLYDGLQS